MNEIKKKIKINKIKTKQKLIRKFKLKLKNVKQQLKLINFENISWLNMQLKWANERGKCANWGKAKNLANAENVWNILKIIQK